MAQVVEHLPRKGSNPEFKSQKTDLKNSLVSSKVSDPKRKRW
jgi:hypothetical protein